MPTTDISIFYPPTVAAWRKWLEKNHVSQKAVWVVFYNKSSKKRTISWSEAVDVALCFGWIDSKKVKIDHETAHQFFSKRKAVSTWSKINKNKVDKLIKEGLMTQAGVDIIEIAKQNGSWTILDETEELIIPKDLEEAFQKKKGSKDVFLGWSKSVKKYHLQYLVLAKRPETRAKRIQGLMTIIKEYKSK